jgi:hypothetical protein
VDPLPPGRREEARLITSNGGAPLLREADRAIGLTAKVARCFRDERAPALVEHRLETPLSQRNHAIALGHEDLNDHASCASIRPWGSYPTRCGLGPRRSMRASRLWRRWPASRRSTGWSTAS